jgi:protein gp37
MGDNTNIEWCDSTANLWIGCTKLSPGCDNCYAERDWDLRKHRVQWGPHGARSYAKAGWALIRKYQRAAATTGVDPQLGRKRRIFVNSLSDFFDNHRSITWRDEAFALFEASPDVILILVTKRPENVAKMVPPRWMQPGGWPAHVWLLVTAEDQARADHRIPILIDLPVPMVGVSAEPLLGPLVFKDEWLERLGWVIVGGESGPKARPMHPVWARSPREQCEDAGVPFLFKQWGEWRLSFGYPAETKGKFAMMAVDPNGWTHTTAVMLDHYPRQFNSFGSIVFERVGKARAGRLLDGRTHDGFPA